MPSRVTGVAIENYRSIVSCDVSLQPLTLLVGPNGSGKSNFLDTLRFVAQSMSGPLDQVVEARYGMRSLLTRLPGGRSAESFRIGIVFDLEDGTSGTYSIRVATNSDGAPVISEETCSVGADRFTSRPNTLTHTAPSTPAFNGDRPALVSFGSLPQFEGVFRLMSGLASYSPSPENMRRPIVAGPGRVLAHNASNAADVLSNIERRRPEIAARLKGYLSSINPEFTDVTVSETEGYRWLAFRPERAPFYWHLNSSDVSDGTLRAIAILLAVFQASATTPPLSLVCLEEPESNLHPAAAGVLLDALLEASCAVSIVASTHSADLLDRKRLPEDALLAVALEGGQTVIGPVSESSRSILRKRLYTAGDLLRNNELTPAAHVRHEVG